VPVVIARAHDCIALLMGSREKYKEYFNANPGTYYRSIGWVERQAELTEQVAGIGLDANLQALIDKYGEDAGRFLYEEMSGYKKNYSRLTFIRTGLEVDDSFRQCAEAEAAEKGWKFEEFDGSTSIFRRLLSGDWNEDFLIVQPGQQIVSSNDDLILIAGDKA
jgi:hypothetical protein